MSSVPFPNARVRIVDNTDTSLPLPADGKAFVHFNFIKFEEIDCPVINRIVIGPDRDAVGEFHAAHKDIPAPGTASSSSDLGFGQVIILSDRGAVAKSLENHLIMVAEKDPVRGAQRPLTVATRVTIAEKPAGMSKADRAHFHEVQAECLEKIGSRNTMRLNALRNDAPPKP